METNHHRRGWRHKGTTRKVGVILMANQNSMTFWWLRVKDLAIPMPETELIKLEMSTDDVFGILDGGKESADAWKLRRGEWNE